VQVLTAWLNRHRRTQLLGPRFSPSWRNASGWRAGCQHLPLVWARSRKLTVSALTDDSKVKFLQTLERSKDFGEIQVQSEHREQNSNEILIDLTAWYVTI
jgi:hypothetical protein